MTIEKAGPEELVVIMALENEVFSKQGIPEEMNSVDARLQPIWYAVKEEGEIIAAIAAWKENGEYHMGRFVVKEEYQGKGIGSGLARFAVRELFSTGAEYFVMDGRPATVKIFTRLGAEVTGEPFRFYGGMSTPLRLEMQKAKL